MAWFNEDVWDEWERMHDEMENLFGRVFRTRTPVVSKGKETKPVKYNPGFRMPVCQMHQTPKSVITLLLHLKFLCVQIHSLETFCMCYRKTRPIELASEAERV